MYMYLFMFVFKSDFFITGFAVAFHITACLLIHLSLEGMPT